MVHKRLLDVRDIQLCFEKRHEYKGEDGKRLEASSVILYHRLIKKDRQYYGI